MEYGDILTPQQLAERLQVKLSWVYEMSRSRGRHGRNGGRGQSQPLPVMRCGRYLRFFWPDVCEWLRSRQSPEAGTKQQTQLQTPVPRFSA
jgi:hypothetical protein